MTWTRQRGSGGGSLPLTEEQRTWVFSPIARYMDLWGDGCPFESEEEARRIYRQHGDAIRREYRDQHGEFYPDRYAPGGDKWDTYWRHAGGS